MYAYSTGINNNISPLEEDIKSNILNKAVLVFSPAFLKSSLNITHVFIISQFQESRHGLAGSFASESFPQGCKVLAGAGDLIRDSAGEGSLPRSYGCCQDTVPWDYLD